MCFLVWYKQMRKKKCRAKVKVVIKNHNLETLTPIIMYIKRLSVRPFMDNDIEQFVKNCPECSKNRLADSTDKWEECAPWENLHMDWLSEAEHGNILIIADAGSGWLEVFPCTNRSTWNVVRCLRTIFSRFGIPYTVVFDNGKEFVSKDLKDWLEAQGGKKIDTPLYVRIFVRTHCSLVSSF